MRLTAEQAEAIHQMERRALTVPMWDRHDSIERLVTLGRALRAAIEEHQERYPSDCRAAHYALEDAFDDAIQVALEGDAVASDLEEAKALTREKAFELVAAEAAGLTGEYTQGPKALWRTTMLADAVETIRKAKEKPNAT